MVPLVGNVKELAAQKELILKTVAEVEKAKKVGYQITVGTMIEVPRAASPPIRLQLGRLLLVRHELT